MKISTVCVLGSLLVSVPASATGVIPVLDLDFTRSATETLKKRGIEDACIIAASTPIAFTYCREGSSTLWKYQALDLDPLATTQNRGKQSILDDGRISVAEVDSVACEMEVPTPFYKSTVTHGLLLALMALFLLVGLRYTYQSIMQVFYRREAYSAPHLPQLARALPAHHLATKALGAFGVAAAVALLYFAL